ncbi:hypothetical protein [Gracilimonas mengyeensis]|uniref:Tat pathway signal sequence domain protein n=1 Tax=Gracilimonas mengyeensis TaxID=1302730 RepID=A0A521C309_9BACT|nr:hypothetical protein [Gracilimonas mengyeensis]SMO53867.1 hypothetical protein SAMN06265219_104116 [Gracilimonas mengyeensis]
MKNRCKYFILPILLFISTGMMNPAFAQDQPEAVDLKWLSGGAPEVAGGVSWGVPWGRGEVQPDETFNLQGGNGENIPVQSWTMAYWPDGSVKWTGFAMSTAPSHGTNFELQAGQESASGEQEIKIRESDTTWEIDTGPLQVLIAKWGGDVIRYMKVDGKTVASNGNLVAIIQDGPELNAWDSPEKQKFNSKVEKVTIEQEGPVRAVVKLEGTHKAPRTGEELLPFVVRLYFYADRKPVKMVHTLIYDGDQDQDFIRGAGIHFKVPMREEMHNRHVRFSGQDDGLWAEPIRPMIGRGGRYVRDGDTDDDVYPKQLDGKRIPNKNELTDRDRYYLSDWAVWGDFKLNQPNADGFTIEKRTDDHSAWIPAGAGKRSNGLFFAGDVSGGLAVSLKDFWQSYPSSLEIQNANEAAADMYVWLWSPDAPAMDMRHYDTKPHGLESVYEDIQQGFSTAYGVGRTSELMLYPTAGVPEKAEMAKMAEEGSKPAMVVASPEYYHSTDMFGMWSLPDRSTPFKRQIEDQLDAYIDYYQTSVEQHNWYGFWDYGDFIHSYDWERHVWRYDLGGMAWQNTELMTDMWLWYSFLRTGRADVFRMAEAMTRHTQEVDVYHMGRFAGLGTRHSVRHWGGGAKEVRVSQAPLKRFFYYLTTDERTGDLIRQTTEDATDAIAKLDPMRIAMPLENPDEFPYPARLRLGPDWLALAGNWMTMWEMTGDEKWKELLYNGMDSISEFSLGFMSGENLVVGFDPETGELFQLSDEKGRYNLATIQGGGEVGTELAELVDHEGWKKAWLQYARLARAPKEVILKDMETWSEGSDGQYARSDRMAAYAYYKTGNPAYAERAIEHLTSRRAAAAQQTEEIMPPEVLNPVTEARWVTTNTAGQWSLNAIQILEMVSDELPRRAP